MKFTSGSLTSLFLHGFLVYVLVVGLPTFALEPEKPKAIQVELVPPPKKPAPKPLQKPKAIDKPKPLPKKTVKVEKPKRPPVKTLRPVQKFDEKTTEAKTQKQTKTDVEKKLTKAPDPQPPKQQQASLDPIVSKPDVSKLEPVAAFVPRPSKPASRPAKPRKVQKAALSRRKTKKSVATTAKGNVKRGRRAGQLCVSELRSQLVTANPPRLPDRLPTYRLTNGNVLQVNRSAFRENSRWINLKFRCEVDKAATEVVSFRFEIGTVIPRSQWARRGLPAS